MLLLSLSRTDYMSTGYWCWKTENWKRRVNPELSLPMKARDFINFTIILSSVWGADSGVDSITDIGGCLEGAIFLADV